MIIGYRNLPKYHIANVVNNWNGDNCIFRFLFDVIYNFKEIKEALII